MNPPLPCEAMDVLQPPSAKLLHGSNQYLHHAHALGHAHPASPAVVPNSPFSDASDSMMAGNGGGDLLEGMQPDELNDMLAIVGAVDFGEQSFQFDYDQTFVPQSLIKPIINDAMMGEDLWSGFGGAPNGNNNNVVGNGSQHYGPLPTPEQPISVPNVMSAALGGSSSAGATATGSGLQNGYFAPAESRVGVITITRQPSQFGRFRYKSEKREKCLEGDQEGTFPEVMIAPEILKAARDITLSASLATRDGKTHWHELMGNTTVNVPSNSNKCRHQFDSLSVIMDKGAGADIRNKDDQRAIRLKFEVSFTINGQRTVSSVLSQPVFNAKLIINKISHAHGPANGGTEVIILCSKIRKSTTAVRIRDVNWTPGSRFTPHDGWTLQGNVPTYHVKSEKLGSHFQLALYLTLPAYHNEGIREAQQVEISITDVEDNTESQPVAFTYTPSESSQRDERNEVKKRRVQDDMNDFSNPSNRHHHGSDNNGGGSGGGSGNVGGENNRSSGRRGRSSNSNSGSGSGSESMQHSMQLDEGSDFMQLDPTGVEIRLNVDIYRENEALQSDLVRFFAMTGDASYLLAAMTRVLRRSDEDNELPLHLAIRVGNDPSTIKMIETLTIAELNHVTGSGDTALHMSVAAQHNDISAKLIYFGAKLTATDARGRSPLHLAAALPTTSTFTTLLRSAPTHDLKEEALAQYDFEGRTPLHVAVRHMLNSATAEASDILKDFMLLDSAFAQTELATGRNALHIAAMSSNVQLMQALVGSVSNTALALEQRDFEGFTPLHHAVAFNNVDIARLLLQRGANPRLLSESGESCFQIAFTRLPPTETMAMLQVLAQERPTPVSALLTAASEAKAAEKSSSFAPVAIVTSGEKSTTDAEKSKVSSSFPTIPAIEAAKKLVEGAVSGMDIKPQIISKGNNSALAAKINALTLAVRQEAIEENWVTDFKGVPSHEVLVTNASQTQPWASMNQFGSRFLSPNAIVSKQALIMPPALPPRPSSQTS